jgi:hypothetical protein
MLADTKLNEVSGVVVSRTRPGVMWVHNDSGDSARVFAIDASGALLQEVHLAGATAIDWEDISLGPGRGGVGSSLYVADTGDNWMIRPRSTVYRIAEPVAGATSARAERIQISYADGAPRNVEAMTVDPVTGDMYLISKQAQAGAAEVFRLERSFVDAGGGTAQRTGVLPDVGQLVTGADVSADGSKIAVTTYDDVYEWRRAPGESVADALRRAPVRHNVGTESESIAYTPDGSSLISIPEGEHAPIFQRREG